jgi:uncharacterized protein (DUF1501 family)
VAKGLANLQRRAFLRRGAALSLAGSAMPWALQLAAMGEAAAAETPTDYKALVCVFLYGGNTVVPYDTANYGAYSTIRGSLATPLANLLPLTPDVALPSGRQMALAPQLTGLKQLFDAGRLGVLTNVGPLMVPTTVAQYNARSVPLPPKLFSHNDQQSVWQSSLAEGATSGWGGRMGDLFLNSNATSTFTCMNVSGNAVFMSGQQAVQYQVSASGAAKLKATTGSSFGSAAVSAALKSLTQAGSTHWLEAEHARIMKRAVDAEAILSSALTATPALATPFNSANSLATQLQMVARTIAARNALSVRRQVFFVSLGGFDLHDNLLAQHPGLLANVSDAITSFDAAMQELGVGPQVTTFTASDFGRTLSSNGGGSDHGWGSHHFIAGGAVAGRRIFGTLPAIAVNGPDDVGQGRLLPTTSVDQLGAALATWFGVSASEMPVVFPNVSHFAQGALPLFR